MAKRRWNVVGRTAGHSICLDHDYWSGNATVTVDDTAVYSRYMKLWDAGLKQRFSVDGLDCTVIARPMPWFTFRYKLLVNGREQRPVQKGAAADADKPRR